MNIRFLVTSIVDDILRALEAENTRRTNEHAEVKAQTTRLQSAIESGQHPAVEITEPQPPEVVEIHDRKALIDAFVEPFEMLERTHETKAEFPGIRVVSGTPNAGAPEAATGPTEPGDTMEGSDSAKRAKALVDKRKSK